MADENEAIEQSDIEKLLAEAGSAQAPTPPADAPPAGGSADALVGQNDIDALLNEAASPPASVQTTAASGAPAAVGARPAKPAPPPVGDADKILGQDDIEALLSGVGTATAAPKAATPPTLPSPFPPEGNMAQGDLDYLLNQAEQALASINASFDTVVEPGVTSYRLQELTGAPPSVENATIEMIRDVELDLKIELGRTQMYLEDVLKLRKGSVVPLDKLAGDPVDIYVNGRLIARGEILVLNNNFCVRVAELVAAEACA
jgi:flagellar motor switch protein FliN